MISLFVTLETYVFYERVDVGALLEEGSWEVLAILADMVEELIRTLNTRFPTLTT